MLAIGLYLFELWRRRRVERQRCFGGEIVGDVFQPNLEHAFPKLINTAVRNNPNQ